MKKFKSIIKEKNNSKYFRDCVAIIVARHGTISLDKAKKTARRNLPGNSIRYTPTTVASYN